MFQFRPYPKAKGKNRTHLRVKIGKPMKKAVEEKKEPSCDLPIKSS